MKHHSPILDKAGVLLLAAGTAASVSSIYLTQPILNLLASELHGSVGQMGLVTTLTQVGFGLGIVFLVPLGDIVPKKGLILVKMLLAVLALVFTGLASGTGSLVAGGVLIGLFASVAQDFVPLAAELSAPDRRGQTIGSVMGGLLLGILGSRIMSGLLAQWIGWRAPFFVNAGLILIAGLLFWLHVPAPALRHRSSYPALMKSLGRLVLQHPLLVLSAVSHGLLGLTFSAFWTMLSFHLGGEAFHLSPSRIGAFALAGFAGAAIAPVAGRFADKHGPLANIRLALVLTGLSFLAMLLFPKSLSVLALGAVAFDLGIQMSMVSHQTIIYALEPEARSRINAVYVGTLFGFFALGSSLAGLNFAVWGWTGVLILCLGSCLLSALMHFLLSRQWGRQFQSALQAGEARA
jgi:predicted MFS family arabinose efflux permease